MRRNIDQIEIQEPPLEELKKKRSCLKHTCASGCGCLFVFLIIALLILKFTAGEKIKEVKSVPDNWPKNIIVYDKDNISKISFISGSDRGRALERIAMAPKLVLSPIFLILEKKFPVKEQNKDGRIEPETNWESFVRIMKEPVADHRDKIQIEWTDVTAEPRFVYNYYKDELLKNNYQINESLNKDQIRQFNFHLREAEIEGVLYIKDNPENKGTDFISLTVNVKPF